MTSDAIVLSSGGLDSTVLISIAAAECANLTLLSFDYGQRHSRELDAARRVAEYFGSEHIVVPLDLRTWGGSALTDPAIDVPAGRGIDDTVPATYVPARNLIFLSIALGLAEARGADAVYIGVNALDYSGYPDCRPEFIRAFERAGALGLKRGIEGSPVSIRAPLVNLSKAEIVREGLKRSAPLDLTWSCYQGLASPCGTCDACVLRAKGFEAAGIPDPAIADGR